MQKHEHIGYHKTFDLRSEFPVSRLYALRKSIGLLVCLFSIWAFLAALRASQATEIWFFRQLLENRYYILALPAAAFVMKYLHAELYRLTFNYSIDGFRLLISRGIVLKESGSLPLLPVSEIYMQRSLLDIVFGLANVSVFTPMDETRRFARVESLPLHHAQRLQNFIGDILTTQVFLAPAALEQDPPKKERAAVTLQPPRSLPALPAPIVIPDGVPSLSKESIHRLH